MEFNREDVRKVVCKIPCGCVTTFGHISDYLVNNIRSAFTIGGRVGELGEEYSFQEVPVHRVVYRNGDIPNVKGNVEELKKEGVEGREYVRRKKKVFQVVDFAKHLWEPNTELK